MVHEYEFTPEEVEVLCTILDVVWDGIDEHLEGKELEAYFSLRSKIIDA